LGVLSLKRGKFASFWLNLPKLCHFDPVFSVLQLGGFLLVMFYQLKNSADTFALAEQ